jgi:hypothetical protein
MGGIVPWDFVEELEKVKKSFHGFLIAVHPLTILSIHSA